MKYGLLVYLSHKRLSTIFKLTCFHRSFLDYIDHIFHAFTGTDFIKTSTGKEGVNAILPVGLVMVRAIREYYKKTGVKVGYLDSEGVLPVRLCQILIT